MPWLPISHRLQRRPAECLAACAAMVLDYLQIPFRYDELVKLLKIGYGGAPFRNLLRLQRMGLAVMVEQGDIETLRRCIDRRLPPIVFVATQQLSYWNEATGHAVVVVGIDDSAIYVNDPSFEDSPKRISIAEFDLAWLDMDEFYALIQRQ